MYQYHQKQFFSESSQPFVQQTASSFKIAVDNLKRQIETKEKPYLSLPYEEADIAAWWSRVEHYQKYYNNIIVLGTGGSSLGGKALYGLKKNIFDSSQKQQLHFMDNIDPVSFRQLLEGLDWSQTGMIVISKSGTTAETLMQFLTCAPYLAKHHPHGFQDCVTIITEPKDSPLCRLAHNYKCFCYDHDPNLGGRFSVMSIVGLLPTSIIGIDPLAVRQGAKSVLEAFTESSAPAQGALSMYGFQQASYSMNVMMIYRDALSDFSLWYRQLWAESLGKKGHGMTPVQATGTVDQHSQMQLYFDGPRDKVFTFISTETKRQDLPPVATHDPDLDYLNQTTMGQLFKAELEATQATFVQQSCPYRSIVLPSLDEKSLGSLMMHFILETVLTASLLKVDPFDQPAVEQGKILTRQYLQAHKVAL